MHTPRRPAFEVGAAGILPINLPKNEAKGQVWGLMLPNILRNMASPRGFEPLLPP